MDISWIQPQSDYGNNLFWLQCFSEDDQGSPSPSPEILTLLLIFCCNNLTEGAHSL